MLCSTDSADLLAELSEFSIPLKCFFQILTISELPFAPPTNVGSDGDLLTFAKMTSWFYQPIVQLLGHWPHVFLHLCGIAAVNI